MLLAVLIKCFVEESAGVSWEIEAAGVFARFGGSVEAIHAGVFPFDG